MTLPFNVNIIQNQLNLYYDLINRYTRDTYPMFFSSKYLAPNSIFFKVGGRLNYFPAECSTSEGMTTLAVSFWRLYQATNDIRWKNLAISVTDAYANYFYLDNPFNANYSQGINSNYCRAHWLVAAYGLVTSEGNQNGNDPFNFGTFATGINFNNGVAQVEPDLSRVFKAYIGKLYYRNLYAPVVNGIEYSVDYWVSADGFKTYLDGRKVVTFMSKGRIQLTTNYTGVLNVAYTRLNGAVVAPPIIPNQGQGMLEPYPCWFPCINTN